MSDYKVLIPFILKWEGGYAEIKGDRGGATNKGVTLSTYQSVFGKNKTKSDLKNISDSEWSTIYKKYFWDKCGADKITDQSVANILVDYAWNSGVSRAIKDVQTIVKTSADGVVGNKTISAINTSNSKELFNKIKNRRIEFYNNIVKSNPSQSKFLKGWTNRVNSLVYGKPYFK